LIVPYQATAALISGLCAAKSRVVHPAPAETRYTDPVGLRVGVLLGVGDQRVQVGHGLRVGHRVGDFHHRGLIGQLQDAALAGVRLESERQEAFLREAPDDVFDVFVHAKDLGDDQYHRVAPRGGRPCLVNRDLEAGRFHRGLGHGQSVGWCRDHLAGDRGRSDGKAGQPRTSRAHAGQELPARHAPACVG